MGITRLIVMTIQGWPETESTDTDGLYATAGQTRGELWAGALYLVKRGDVHTLLVSTKPIHESKEAAVASIRELVTEMKALDLEALGTFASREANGGAG